MNSFATPQNTSISWHLLTTKPSTTNTELLEFVPEDISNYVAEYQLYEFAPEEILSDSVSSADSYQAEARSKILEEINALYGAWADRDDIDDDLIIDEPSYLHPTATFKAHFIIKDFGDGKLPPFFDEDVEIDITED